MSLGVVVYFVHYGLLLFLLGQYYAPLSRAGVVVIEEISSLFVLGVRRVVRRLVHKTLVDELIWGANIVLGLESSSQLRKSLSFSAILVAFRF